ncbi:MAG TPA: GNAT family N-acetyltransferase [Aquificales bacterium]|nr:GNAT family N-acetyltransferase [Aquificales bacterium]
MEVFLYRTTPQEVEEKLFLPYKGKYENDDEERIYIAFLEHALKDALEGLTAPYFILNENDEPIGLLTLSNASIKIELMEYGDAAEWGLYGEDVLTDLPAIRLDLFLILPPYRNKGYGRRAVRKLLAFLAFIKRQNKDISAYKYLITFSTNRRFSKLLMEEGFKPLIDGSIREEIEGRNFENYYGSLSLEEELEIIKNNLGDGIWFYFVLEV